MKEKSFNKTQQYTAILPKMTSKHFLKTLSSDLDINILVMLLLSLMSPLIAKTFFENHGSKVSRESNLPSVPYNRPIGVYICFAQSENRYNSGIVLRKVGILTLSGEVGILTLRRAIPELLVRKVGIGTK